MAQMTMNKNKLMKEAMANRVTVTIATSTGFELGTLIPEGSDEKSGPDLLAVNTGSDFEVYSKSLLGDLFLSIQSIS